MVGSMADPTTQPSLCMTEDKDLISYLLLFWFGRKENTHLEAAPILNYKSISKTVWKPLQSLRWVILLGFQAIKEKIKLQPTLKVKFQQPHIEYLISHHELKECAHLSIIKRAKMFHRAFPQVKISPSYLQRIYEKHGVRFKFLKTGKKVIDYTN